MIPRLCTSGTVVCIASGPSLTQADVDSCRGRATVIVVNDAWRLAPWADVLYSSDGHWWRHYRGVPDFAGLKVGMARVPGGPTDPPTSGVITLRNTGKNGIEWSKTGLRTHQNSGGAAINLAVHLFQVPSAHRRRILLLGYDMGPAADGTLHFFGGHPQPLSNHSPYVDFRKRMKTMVKPLAAAGIDIVNCSRETRLTCFPRGVITEQLQERAA